VIEVCAAAFHEKAGASQDGFVFTCVVSFAFEPGRLCRHPPIGTRLLMESF
jgi:hypothetical protein